MTRRLLFLKEDLDCIDCAYPECEENHDELVLHSTCHPTQGTTVVYPRLSGVLKIHCKECGALIAEIAVARSDDGR